jgi:hypothetical protein
MNLPSLENSRLFSKWKDPESQVTSFLLHRRIAPLQQSFYFTNDSFSRDARYYWFYCAFPPGGDAYYGRQLGVVDFAGQRIHHFPETQFMDASPFVEPDTGEVYWTTGLEVWKRSPDPSARAERVGIFPYELAKGRRPLRLATHLTLSSDKTSLAIDAQIGNEWFVGDLPLDGSGFRLWQQFDRCYNHAQFSPTDPDLLLIAQDGWVDAATGEQGGTEDRLWLLRRGEKAKPIFPNRPSALRGHEWWDPDGLHVWYVHYNHGTEKVNILTGEITAVPGRPIHSHADRQGLYVASDRILAPETWQVTFTNITTGKTIPIASHLSPLPIPRSRYHVHPHPHFCLDDKYICYTTNVLGQVDVAFVSVAELIASTE